MTRIIEWLISLLIVVALFVVIGLFLPAKRVVSHSVETNRPMTTVYDTLNGFVRFKDWNALVNHDPNVRLDVSGPEAGVGARLAYVSADHQIGEGSWEIVESVPGQRIVFALNTPGRGKDKRMTFEFERTGQRRQNVKITQTYSVDYGWNLLGRYAGLYVTRDIGDDIKRGLAKFSNLLATIPRFDYSRHDGEYAVVELPAVNALLARTNAKRANDEIALAMTNQMKWIEQVMEKSGLEPAGPMRIVTNDFGPESYAFDVVQPVRRKGSGPAEGEDAAGEADGNGAGDGADAGADAVADTLPPERLEVVLDGDNNPVFYVQIPAMKAATTTYVGPSPGLALVRDQLRAWAMVRGHETGGRPFEEYRVEIKNMLAEDAEFTVYWPLRVDGKNPPEPVQILPEPEEDEAPAAGEGEAEAGPAQADEAA
ncbi:SRPBCC family protein [Arenimonas fontis]|nr:SRPBCC family protein [Arenimonas fontis]